MPTIHASCVLAGARAVLIQGPSGSGKSRLALDLIHASQAGQLRLGRLVADDRVLIEACHGRLVARPPAELAGLIEIRGLGIRQVAYEPVVVVGLMVELAAKDAQRLPTAGECVAEGIRLPSIAVAAGADPLPLVLAALATQTSASPKMAEK